jgi:hypothetical protein
MTLMLAALTALGGGELLVLREKAPVTGKYIPLLSLVQTERLSEASRRCLATVYLGCAPEAGKSRTITAGRIRRELTWRGLMNGFRIAGGQVVVGEGPRVDSREPAVIRKGQQVRAVSPAYEVDARALEEGMTGRVIRVEFLSTGRRARARIVGEGRVEVLEAGR